MNDDDADTAEWSAEESLARPSMPTRVEVAAAEGTAGARLVVLAGGRIGQRFPLQSVSMVGRGAHATVALEDPTISRSHAVIVALEDGGYEVQDVESINGTFVNGVRVAGRAKVRFGDRIQFGGLVTLFTHADPLEEQIHQRQKLEAIGRLGAGMAHDVNNLLAGVLTNADFLIGLGAEPRLGDPVVLAALGDLRAAAFEAAEFTKRILTFARKGSGAHTQVDLTQLVSDALDMARRSMDRSVSFQRELESGVHVRGERVLLQQAIMNVLLNARDAMPTGGTIAVGVRRAMPSEVNSERVALAASHALITIRDTGTGMSQEVRQQIFDPFFTTKGATGGSGLGLAMLHEVVLAHGGSVDCDSVLGTGTEFRIVLPALVVAGRSERPTPIALSIRPRSGAALSVLLVDDEPLSRRGVARVMERDGHRVRVSGDGAEALEWAKAEPKAFDVALLDLDLPGLDGQELQAQLRIHAPSVRVVFLTGFVADTRRAALLEAGAVAVLGKPCDLTTLRATLLMAMRLPM